MALAGHLRSGHLGGAAVDVYSSEPPGPDNPLLKLAADGCDRLWLTPHIAGVTRQASQVLFRTAVFQPLFGEYSEQAYPVLLAFLVVFFFNPLNRRVQDSVDRWFFRKKVDYKHTVISVSNALTSLLNLDEVINRINTQTRDMFRATFEQIRDNFRTMFVEVFGGGKADIILEDPANALECGIDIIARPPGKEPQSISLLSGGEKTLTAVALLMGVFRSRPSPFAILDEVDAALDEANVERFNSVLQEFLARTQFVVITHSKRTMACADILYGVTMEEPGVSKRVSVRFEESVRTPNVA